MGTRYVYLLLVLSSFVLLHLGRLNRNGVGGSLGVVVLELGHYGNFHG